MGYKVWINHDRPPELYDTNFIHSLFDKYDNGEDVVWNVHKPRGGQTIVVIKDVDVVYTGKAICDPKDNYNKKLGTAIAIRRALSNMSRHELQTIVASIKIWESIPT